MNAPSTPPLARSADKVFLALGQTLYACQLLEGTMLEIMATANEVLDGTGDGKLFYESIEALSRKTLGQLIHELRKRADLRPDIEDHLCTGLEARNFIVHRFAKHVGDDLTNEAQTITCQRHVYQKCALVMNANDIAVEMLHALGRHHAEESVKKTAELEATTEALRELTSKISLPKH